MKILATLGSAALLADCSSADFPPAYDVPCQSPIASLANSGATEEDRRILREASEDFCAVVAGKNPVHARYDSSAPRPADGGTSYYKGRKYSLTVLHSLSSFGSIHGVVHGPMITFDEDFAPGNTNVISHLRVYPSAKSD